MLTFEAAAVLGTAAITEKLTVSKPNLVAPVATGVLTDNAGASIPKGSAPGRNA